VSRTGLSDVVQCLRVGKCELIVGYVQVASRNKKRGILSKWRGVQFEYIGCRRA